MDRKEYPCGCSASGGLLPLPNYCPIHGNRRETLAALQHTQWSGWMRHLFSRCVWNDERGMLIPREWADRWHRQVETPYSELSEAEKNSDREEADRVLALLNLDQRA